MCVLADDRLFIMVLNVHFNDSGKTDITTDSMAPSPYMVSWRSYVASLYAHCGVGCRLVNSFATEPAGTVAGAYDLQFYVQRFG
jgi:hypothetical protein